MSSPRSRSELGAGYTNPYVIEVPVQDRAPSDQCPSRVTRTLSNLRARRSLREIQYCSTPQSPG